VGRWRSDLALVADTMSRVHPNLYHSVSRERFRAELDSLSARVPSLDHDQLTVELGRIVALVGDGHTRLTFPFDSAAGFFTGHSTTAPPLVPGPSFGHLPLRLGLFSDGLYVVRTTAAHRALLGGRVVEIGTMPVSTAMAAVEPAVQRDNDRQVADLLPKWLVVPEILHARGVTPDRRQVRWVVELPTGRRAAVLAPLPPGVAPTWLEARRAGSAPLAERRPDARHWFERVEGTRVLYARYREVYDDPGQTIAQFADSLFGALDKGEADRLILDLRGNVGGNGFLNQPIVRGIIGTRALQRPGSLFVLADRGTFSAAMMLLAQLEKETPAVIVGEKSGATPNGYGDSRRIRLPATGLTLRVSSLYWQMSDPRDSRDGITPHVATETRYADWRDRRDPALDTALGLCGPPADPDGAWNGELGLAYQRIPIALRVERQGEGWRAWLDAPALQAQNEALEDAGLDRGEFVCARRAAGPPWIFRAHVTAGAMTGVALYQGALVRFRLTRAPR
jgi:hypothetical protein